MIPVSLTSSRTSLQGPANRYAQARSRARKEPPLSPGERQRKFLAEANSARERKRSAVVAAQGDAPGPDGGGSTIRRRGNSVDPARTLEHRKSAPPASVEFAKGLRSILSKSPSRAQQREKDFLALPARREDSERRASGSDDLPPGGGGSGVEPLDRHVSCVNLPSRTLSPTWALTSLWRSTSSVFASSCGSQPNLEDKPSTTSTTPIPPGKPKLKRRVSAWEAVKKKAQRSLTWLTARSEESLLECRRQRRRRRSSEEEEETGFPLSPPPPPPLDFIGSPPAAPRSLPGSPCGAIGPGATVSKKTSLDQRSSTLPEGELDTRRGRSRDRKNRDLYKTKHHQEPKVTQQDPKDQHRDSKDHHHHHHHHVTFAGFFHKLRKTNSDGGGKRGGMMGQQPSWVVVEFPSSCLESNTETEAAPVRGASGDLCEELLEEVGMETEVAVSDERIVVRKKPLAKAKSAEVPKVTTTRAIVERTSDSVFVSEEEEEEEEDDEVPPPPPPHRTTWTSADLHRDVVTKAVSVDSGGAGAVGLDTSKVPSRSDRKRRTLTRSHAINVHPFGDHQQEVVRLTPPEKLSLTRVKSADGQPSSSSLPVTSLSSSSSTRLLRREEKESPPPPPVPPHQNQSIIVVADFRRGRAKREVQEKQQQQQQQQQPGTPTSCSTFRRKLPSEEGDLDDDIAAMKLDPADRSQSTGGLLAKQRPVSLILSKKSVSSSQYSTNGQQQQYEDHHHDHHHHHHHQSSEGVAVAIGQEQSTMVSTTSTTSTTTATIVKYTSQDSIGNCSLNVNAATAGEADGLTPDNLNPSASTRELKSVSMDPADLTGSSRRQWPTGSGAHVIAPGNGPSSSSSSGSIRRRIGSIEILDNRPPVGTQQFDSHPGLKPSYVHLACAVSGYSDINRYNSKLRDGFRSRDSSPVKIAWLRNSSGMISPNKSTTFIPGDENGHTPLQRLKSPTLVVSGSGNGHDSPVLSPRTPSGLRSPLKVLEIQHQQEKLLRGGYGATTYGCGRSVSVDRAGLMKVSPHFFSTSSPSSSYRKSGSWARAEHEYLDTDKERQSRSSRRAANNGAGSAPSKPNGNSRAGNGDATTVAGQEEDKEYAEAISTGKSFIQQRIERLYGQQRRKSDAEDEVDAAVAVAMTRRRDSVSNKKDTTFARAVVESKHQHVAQPAPGTPPVFRHLRQEFREQLPVAKVKSAVKKQQPRAVSSVQVTLARPDLEKAAQAEVKASKAAGDEEPSASLSAASSGTTPGASTSVHLSADHDKEAALSLPAADVVVLEDEEKPKAVEPVLTRSPSPTTDAMASELDNDEESSATDSYSYPIVKDGTYYVKVMDDERERLTTLVVRAEEEVAPGNLSEEVSGILRATTGKARLLLNQKFAQFKSLCDQNLIPGGQGESKVTDEDLAGFWDLVSIQVEQINEMFKDIDVLRKNNWRSVDKPDAVTKSTRRPSTTKKRSGPSPTPRKTPSPANAVAAAASRAEERRKQLIEAKRRMKKEMEEKLLAAQGQGNGRMSPNSEL